MTISMPNSFGSGPLRKGLLALPSLFFLTVVSLHDTAHAQTVAPFRGKPVTIEAHGRVLSDVLEKVQLAFNSPINYEELPLENASDLKTVAVPGALISKHLVSPASDLTVTLTDLDSTPYLAAQTVISSYTQAGYPGSYKVIQLANRIDVVPAQLRSSSGSMHDVRPILTQPLTFPVAKRSVGDTIQLMIDAVSKQSGYPVLPVRVPGLRFKTIEFGANGESVGDVIEHLGAELGSSLCSIPLRT
jgi:hypothetical protein